MHCLLSCRCAIHNSGKKSDNPPSPDYVPSVFKYTTSPDRRRLKKKLVKFERTQAMKKKRIEQQRKVDAANALLQLRPQPDYPDITPQTDNTFMEIEVKTGAGKQVTWKQNHRQTSP